MVFSCLSCVGPIGAAETAVLRHPDSGDQTTTGNGGTADEADEGLTCGDDDAAVVFAMPGSLSHTAGLEASATGGAAAPCLALADPAVGHRPVVHDLVRR